MPIQSPKYFKRGILLPAGLILTVHFISYIIHENSIGSGQQSDYFTQNALSGASFVLVLINTILVVAISSPILLVDLSVKGKFSRFLWWFLVLASWLLYLAGRGIQNWLQYEDHDNDVFYTLSNSVPYLVGLIWSYAAYIRFLSKMKNGLPDLEVITKPDRKIQQSHTPPPQSPMG